MANNPITTPLPADLPTNWTYGQTIGASGIDVGLTEQHGYNYLMKQVNAAQQAATQIGQSFSGIPSLGSDGKIPSSQLPAMNYDPAGSAAAVQKNLDAHTGNKNNPHAVTAAQVGADPAGSAAAVQSSLSAHTGNRSNPHGVTAQQVGADPAGTAAAVQQALASQIAALTTQMGGKVSFQTGTYSGTGESTNILDLPVTPKVLIIMINPKSDWTKSVQIPLVAICPGYYLTQTTTTSGSSMSYLQVKEFGATVKITAVYDYNAYNDKGKTYTWVALY